jgi:hypothetical protein
MEGSDDDLEGMYDSDSQPEVIVLSSDDDEFIGKPTSIEPIVISDSESDHEEVAGNLMRAPRAPVRASVRAPRPMRAPVRNFAQLMQVGTCIGRKNHDFQVSRPGILGHTFATCKRCKQSDSNNTSLIDYIAAQPGPSGEECSICGSGFDTAAECVTACDPCHLFHYTCLTSWFKMQRSVKKPMTCPLCRGQGKLIYYGDW